MKSTTLACALLLVASASGQWLETTVDVPEQFCSSLMNPQVAVYNPANGRVYIGGAYGTEVAVLDGATGAKLAKVSIGSNVNSACCDPVHNKVYFVTPANTMVVVDGEADTVEAVNTLPGEATDICYDPQENKVYCAGWYPDVVTAFDGATNQIVATIPVLGGERKGLCYYPPGNKMYCTSTSGKVLVIDCLADTVTDTVTVGSWAHLLCYDPVDDKMYCANFNDRTITAIDLQADTVLATIQLSYAPMALCHNVQDNKLYCTGGGIGPAVTMIDPTRDSVVASVGLPAGLYGRDICYDEFIGKVYSVSSRSPWPSATPPTDGARRDGYPADTMDGLVTIVDGATGTLVRHLLVGPYPEAVCGGSGGGVVFAANLSGQDVAVIDATSDSMLRAIPLTGGPRALCWSRTSNKTYCGNRLSKSVTVIDGETNVVLKSIPVGGEPWALCYNSVNDKVYCSLGGTGNSVKVIDAAFDSVVATVATIGNSRGLCYSGEDNRVYCAVDTYATRGNVTVISGASNARIAQVSAGNGAWIPYYNPSSRKVYCANVRDNTVTVVSCSTNSVVATVPVGTEPTALCGNPQDNKVYCANASGGSVTVIDGAQNSVLATLPAKGTARSLCYNATDNKVYCAGRISPPPTSQGWLSIYDGHGDTVITHRLLSSASATNPCSLYYNLQNDKVYCADYGLSTVWVVDGATNSIVRSLDVPDGPMTLAWNVTDNRTYVSCYLASGVAIIRDSLVVGVQETSGSPAMIGNASPAVVRGVLFLSEGSSPQPQVASLVDASGRNVMRLLPGANDVSALAPGVYFVRTASSVHKVVLAK